MDTATGYKYNVFNSDVEEKHTEIHDNFLDNHMEIVEYQYWMGAAAESTFLHYLKDQQIGINEIDYKIENTKFTRFWATYDITAQDFDGKMTCYAVENRDFEWSAFDCSLKQVKFGKDVNILDAYSFIEDDESNDDSDKFVLNTVVSSHYDKKSGYQISLSESDEGDLSTSVTKLSKDYHIWDAIKNFQTRTRQGPTTDIYNTDLAVAAFVDAYKYFGWRADYHDLRVLTEDTGDNSLYGKVKYYNMWYDANIERLEEDGKFTVSKTDGNSRMLDKYTIVHHPEIEDQWYAGWLNEDDEEVEFKFRISHYDYDGKIMYLLKEVDKAIIRMTKPGPEPEAITIEIPKPEVTETVDKVEETVETTDSGEVTTDIEVKAEEDDGLNLPDIDDDFGDLDSLLEEDGETVTETTEVVKETTSEGETTTTTTSTTVTETTDDHSETVTTTDSGEVKTDITVEA